jgi:hypothetical protein
MNNDPLTQNQITDILTERKNILNSLRPEISRKVYYTLEEKIVLEEKQLQQILDWQEGRNSQLSRYSLILDSHYFDQEFMN